MFNDGQVDKVFQSHTKCSLAYARCNKRKCSLAYARCQLSNNALDVKLLSS